MAQSTQQQVSALEAAMSEQFFHLATAAAFRISIARKFGLDNAAFKKYNAVYAPLVTKWVLREVKYETELLKNHIKGIISSGDLKVDDFYTSASLPKLIDLVKKWNKEKTITGMGFIPLLIWAVIALAGFFTAKTIVDDLTTTTQEKEELLKTTQDTAKELGLTPEQASSLISQTQQEASAGSGFGDITKWLLIAAGAAILLPQLLRPSTTKT